MKSISILSSVFCLYAIIANVIKLITFRYYIGESENILEIHSNFEMRMLLLWSIAFSGLIILGLIATRIKSERLKIWFISLTLLFALFMSVTDNIETKFYLSDIVVNGEMLE